MLQSAISAIEVELVGSYGDCARVVRVVDGASWSWDVRHKLGMWLGAQPSLNLTCALHAAAHMEREISTEVFHGLITQLVSSSPMDDDSLFTGGLAFCAAFGSVQHFTCLHGVGHGAMFKAMRHALGLDDASALHLTPFSVEIDGATLERAKRWCRLVGVPDDLALYGLPTTWSNCLSGMYHTFYRYLPLDSPARAAPCYDATSAGEMGGCMRRYLESDVMFRRRPDVSNAQRWIADFYCYMAQVQP
jgi:hypothetical protein